MKIEGVKDIVLEKQGTVKMVPEEPDDLWLLYNLIAPGDFITATSSRKVHRDSSGKNSTERVKVNLEIKITSIDYDKDSSTVRVKGKNITANQHVPTGSFHTLTLEKDKEFGLRKKLWDSVAIDTLREGCSMASSAADLAVVLIQQGSAHLFLVGRKVTTLSATIEFEANSSTTKKGSSNSNKFFENLFGAFVKHVNFNSIRCVVIGSSGSIKDEFRRYLLSEAQRLKIKSIEDNKSRIATSSTDTTSLNEVLSDNTVINLIKDTKVVSEIRAFKEFSDMLTRNSDRACYGSNSVGTAHEMKAIETLLVIDDLFRSAEIETRQKYVGLVKSVKKAGGKVFVFSSVHVSGKELAKLTGIAAVLRFPLPDLDYMVL